MPSQFQSAMLATLLTVVINVSTAETSDWKPSVEPTSAITQVSFKEPVTGPSFEAEDAAFEPPLLPPILEEEEPESDDPEAAEAPAEPETPDEVPNFEPEESEPVKSAGKSDEGLSNDEPAENSASKVHDEPGKSSLKVLEDDEESEDLLKPEEWFGHWNESSLDWVLRNGDNGIGFFSFTGDTPSWNFDVDAKEEGLQSDFGTGIHFVDGPGRAGADLPPRLFDIFWNTRFKAETDDGFGIDANFKIGLFTDFEDSVREGWRFPGRVLGYATMWGAASKEKKRIDKFGLLVLGFEYLDLEQTEILPAGGMILEMTPDVKVDLYFPRPQIRLRVDQEESGDQWLYFRGEYHGSAWAIERNTGNADVVSLTEYRATIGLETVPKDKEESTSFLEVGFLFHRDLEYRSGVGNFQPDDTIVIRLGSRY